VALTANPFLDEQDVNPDQDEDESDQEVLKKRKHKQVMEEGGFTMVEEETQAMGGRKRGRNDFGVVYGTS